MDAQKERGAKEYNRTLDDEDPLKDEEADDLETGPFLGPGSALHRKPMDKGLRRLIIIVVAVFVGGWLAGLGIFIHSGAHVQDDNTDWEPPSFGTEGTGTEQITMDQIFQGYWAPKSHSISWVPGPDGEDGLLIEVGASGKDYMVVEDVRSKKESVTDDESATIMMSRTLIEKNVFQYDGKMYNPEWTRASPDLKKVLVGVRKEKNWRHSFTATYFILDVESQEVEPLVPEEPEARIQLASWNAQSNAISFTRDNNLFIRSLDDKGITQITDDGGPEYFYGIPDWVYEEEVFGGPSATWWSDDGKYLAFLRTNETGVPEYPVQFFISRPSGKEPEEGEESYPEVQQIKYPKAGAHNPVVDLQFYDVEKKDTFSVTIDGDFEDDNRIINNLVWAGDKVIVKETNRVSDILKVILIDVASRSGKTVNTIDVDKIDGGWFEISHKMTYIPADPANGRPDDGYVDTIIHEDFDHLAYFTPLDNPQPIMLTSGRWEVEDAPSAVDLKNNLVYFIGTRESSIQRHVYSVKLDGSDLTPLTNTSAEAYYSASFSSGAGFVLLSYRGPKIPYQQVISTPSSPSTYSHTIEDNAELAARAKKHAFPAMIYDRVNIGGIMLNVLQRRPPGFSRKKKYPVLFQQYSGPGSQSVTQRFSVDFQTYVAATLGYIVVTVDPRGTGFLGRKHRVAVRNNLGLLESHDHIAVAKLFTAHKFVDPDRLAIWGWSYGGFTTLKTLEQDAGQTFSYGMAVAPVTDWRFYDSIYTERYMRTPQENPEGYDASKVANASALGQNKRFLLMHGVADDNVHFQNSLTLLDDLDLAGVENYDVHVFPDSDHSIYFHNGNRIVYDSKFHPYSQEPKHMLTRYRTQELAHQCVQRRMAQGKRPGARG